MPTAAVMIRMDWPFRLASRRSASVRRSFAIFRSALESCMVITVLPQSGRYLAKSPREVCARLCRSFFDCGPLFTLSAIRRLGIANGIVDYVDNPGHCPGSLVMLWRPLMILGAASPVATPAPYPTLRARARASRSWARIMSAIGIPAAAAPTPPAVSSGPRSDAVRTRVIDAARSRSITFMLESLGMLSARPRGGERCLRSLRRSCHWPFCESTEPCCCGRVAMRPPRVC